MDGADSAPAAFRDAMGRGHAARAAGDPDAALHAYAEAARMAPAEAEPALHRGHALRSLGREAEATSAYALAAAMDPYSAEVQEARQRLKDGVEPPPPPAPPPAPASSPALPRVPAATSATPSAPSPSAPLPPAPLPPVPSAPSRSRRARMRAGSTDLHAAEGTKDAAVLDVTDLLLHFGHSRIPTGIQRVTSGIAGAAVRRRGRDARIVVLDPEGNGWRAVPPTSFGTLLGLVASEDEAAWDAARDDVMAGVARGGAARLGPGEALVSLGSPWGIEGHLRAVRRSGARWVPFLHDCAPLDRPEHCVRGLVEAYARWFAAVALQASGVICNSEATRAAGEAHLDALTPGLDLPMGVVRLDADPRGAAPDEAAARALLGDAAGHPYVLFVATIESRKDHLTVLRAWLALLRRHGAAHVPRLVLAGAKGWHAEAALGLLENSPDLVEHVVIVHGASDGALAALYAGCLFTLYNSHLEGWGLPVTESIAWGKVPVVADLPALRESGGDAAVYVEPQSESAMAAAVAALLEPGALRAGEAALAAARPLRRWEDLEGELSAMAGAMAAAPPRAPRLRATLPLGERLSVARSDSGRPDLPAAFAEGLRDEGSWEPMTPDGAPFRNAVSLRVPLGALAPAGPARLGLEVTLPADGVLDVEVRLDGEPAARGRLGPAATGADGGEVATGVPFVMPDEAREAEVRLRVGGDGTAILRGLMICGEDDLLARIGFVEAQAIRRVTR